METNRVASAAGKLMFKCSVRLDRYSYGYLQSPINYMFKMREIVNFYSALDKKIYNISSFIVESLRIEKALFLI